jgi:hypothetical protein
MSALGGLKNDKFKKRTDLAYARPFHYYIFNFSDIFHVSNVVNYGIFD